MPITRLVDSAIYRLRHKIEPDFHQPTFIQSSHADGYYLTFEQIDLGE
jgi:DNA-binding response OmpR family regulator